MKSAVIIIVAIWAATAPLPKRARFYFWVEVVGACSMEGLRLLGVPNNSDGYELVYTICTLAICVSGFILVLETLRKVYGVSYRRLLIAEAILSGAFFTYIAAYAVLREYHEFPYFLYLVLGEATLLWISGTVLTASTPLLKGTDRLLCFVLSIAWIGRAMVLYGYSINVLGNRQLWLVLASYLPAMLFTVTCAYLGTALRVKRTHGEI